MIIYYLCCQRIDSEWGEDEKEAKLTERRGIFTKTSDFNNRFYLICQH